MFNNALKARAAGQEYHFMLSFQFRIVIIFAAAKRTLYLPHTF